MTDRENEVVRIRAMQVERGDLEARQLLADEIVKLRSALASSQQRWRKWPEEKPDRSGLYCVTHLQNGQPEVLNSYFYADQPGNHWDEYDVTHWMPLPTPPYTKKEDKG